MLAASPFTLGFQGVALAPQPKVMMAEGMAPDFSDKPWTSGEISDKAGLASLAKELNPIVGFWCAMCLNLHQSRRQTCPMPFSASAMLY